VGAARVRQLVRRHLRVHFVLGHVQDALALPAVFGFARHARPLVPRAEYLVLRKHLLHLLVLRGLLLHGSRRIVVVLQCRCGSSLGGRLELVLLLGHKSLLLMQR